MRDLAIRGAGNLLGKQQHGFIDSVGYDLYSAMLSDAVAKKQGKKQNIHSDAEVELGVEAYLPTDLIDRFGDYPAPVGTLLLVSQLKNHADLAMIAEIKRQRDNINIKFTERASRLIKAPAIIKELANTRFKATIGEDDQQLTIRLVIQPKMTTDDWLHQLLQFVMALGNVIQADEKGAEK